LTFNTTILPLNEALEAKRLLVRAPLRPLGEPQRWLIAEPDIDAMLDGHMHVGLFPTVSSERLIGIFAAGHLLTVSRKFTNAKPDVEQIVGHPEVWALCPRTPRPGWRLLGRFIDSAHFVALRAWDKRHLFRKYDEAAAEVIEDWKVLFGDLAPFSSPHVSAYLGGVFRDVDEES
jgi:hypothetical protein